MKTIRLMCCALLEILILPNSRGVQSIGTLRTQQHLMSCFFREHLGVLSFLVGAFLVICNARAEPDVSAFKGDWLGHPEVGVQILIRINPPSPPEVNMLRFIENKVRVTPPITRFEEDPNGQEYSVNVVGPPTENGTKRNDIVFSLSKNGKQLQCRISTELGQTQSDTVLFYPLSQAETNSILGGSDDVALFRAKEASRSASCQNNLKQFGLFYMLYANDNANYFPALDSRAGRFAPQVDKWFRDTLADPGIFLCPSDQSLPTLPKADSPDAMEKYMDDHSYWYLGYALPDVRTIRAFGDAYKRQAASGGGFSADLKDGEGHTVYRLHEKIAEQLRELDNEQRTLAELQAQIPIMLDRPENHGVTINVLFFDGHVEHIEHPENSEKWSTLIRTLIALDQKTP